jgi:2-polyprenyl-3-methyl-5-hydroxy-6-metoxy-1,4-benzoquinol methylase
VSDQDHLDEPEWLEFNPEVEDSWNQNAAFWDDYMGAEGNDWHKFLIRPATERLLEIQPNEVVLDIACGNGNFSRHLARLGARVVATDLSEAMLARAQAYPTEQADRITYQVLDATDEAQLLALGQNRFDAAVSNMALMDMVTIEPLLAALAQVLKPGGRFVFSIMHPCFQSRDMAKIAEQEERDGELVTRYAVKVSSYIKPVAFTGVAIIGQPVLQHYFHRPLSVLFKSCFQAEFVLDGLEEPVFEAEPDGRGAFSWTNLNEIPPVLVVRMRLGSVTSEQ